jgi:hypothetical protein
MALPSNAHLIVHGFIGYCTHNDVIAGVPTIVGYVDFGVVNGVTGTFSWPTAKFAYPPAREPERGGALAWGLPMEGRETDATLIVPHVPVSPMLAAGPLLPLTILFGSSAILMGSHKTRIWCKPLSPLVAETEKPVGCCLFPYIPISLNLQCWEIGSKKLGPVGAPVMSDVVVAPNTVQVGVEFTDYLTVIVEWGIQVLLAFVMAYATKPDPAKPLTADMIKKAVKKKWAIGIGFKLPYKLLVKNTEWSSDLGGDAKKKYDKWMI